MRTTKIGPYLRLPSVQITVLTFLVKKKKKKNEAFRCVFFLKTRKNFKLNLALVLVHVPKSQGDVTRDDSQRRFLARHGVAMLERCCNHSKQRCNNAATLCCAQNRRCESSRVTSPSRSLVTWGWRTRWRFRGIRRKKKEKKGLSPTFVLLPVM